MIKPFPLGPADIGTPSFSAEEAGIHKSPVRIKPVPAEDAAPFSYIRAMGMSPSSAKDEEGTAKRRKSADITVKTFAEKFKTITPFDAIC